jgi:8-amino-7-oxononanoate synthase
LIEWLVNRARSYVFSTALPEAACAASRESLAIIRREPKRRQRLLQAADKLRLRLQADGWNTGNSQSQIVPVQVGCPARAVDLSARFLDANCLVPAIRPPTVPRGESCLRISLSYSHTDQDMDRLVKLLAAEAPGRAF